MLDSFGRKIEYLRLSVTDKCNLNCSYCKRTVGKENELITLDEIKKTIRLFSLAGFHKVRLTGGEPLAREDIEDIIKICKATQGIEDIALTTNGILLSEKAYALKNAGLCRVNISIDSLDSTKYRKITKADSIRKVLEGIDTSIEAGLNPVKINVVLMDDVNDDEIDRFIDLTKDKAVEVRFIEYMPMGGEHAQIMIKEKDIVSSRPHLMKCEEQNAQVANMYRINGYKGRTGFISPMSQPFCSSCNRIRVTADCKIRYCLGNNNEINLREILKNSEEKALELIQTAIMNKPEKGFCEGFITNRGMGNIGG